MSTATLPPPKGAPGPPGAEDHTDTPRSSSILRAPIIVAFLAVVGALWGWFDIDARYDPDTGQIVRQDDYQVYREAALALRRNTSLYEARNARNWPYLYPPLLALLVMPFTALTGRVEFYAWFLFNLSLAVLCFAFMHRLAMAMQPPEGRVPVIWAHLVILFPMIETLHRGQANVVMFLFIAVGLWLLHRGRAAAAGLVLAGASAVKVTPLLLGVWMGWKLLRALRLGRSAAGRPAAALAGFVVGVILWWWALPGLVLGPGRTGRLLSDYHRAVTANYVIPGETLDDAATISAKMILTKSNQSWYHLFARMTGAEPGVLSQPGRVGLGVWLLGLLVGALWLSRAEWGPRGSPALLCEAAVVLLLGVTAGKLAWNHVYLVAWPMVVFAERTIQPGFAWRSVGGRRVWLAALWAFTVLWAVQATARHLVGGCFPLLISATGVAGTTLWLLQRCQTDRLARASETN